MSLYADAVLASSPLGYYRFEEVSGLIYADSSGNSNDISAAVGAEHIGDGAAFWSGASRISDTGVECTALFSSINDFSFEVLFRADTPGDYVLAEAIPSGSNVGVLVEISEDTGSPGDYLLKFGLGAVGWDIDTDDTNEHVYVYTDEASDLFDGEWHHIVCVWDGTVSTAWDSSELTIYIDGSDRTDAATGAEHSITIGVAPISFAGNLWVTGPATGGNDETSYYDELAVYDSALSIASVLEHYNRVGSLEPIDEFSIVYDLIPYTAGVLETITETDSLGSLSVVYPELLIEGISNIILASDEVDSLGSREILDEEGELNLSLEAATLETGEPNAAGYIGTKWYELPANSQSVLTMRVALSSLTSTGKVSIYKQPSLDDYEDSYDLAEEDGITSVYEDEPTLGGMVLVQTASTDQVFTLDQEYGSSYFLQVGLLTGDGNDFTLVWEDADPLEGGTFEWPIEASGTAGKRLVNTKNAWLQSGEPDAASITETRSVWVEWTAPADPPDPILFVISGGSSLPFGSGIYTGSAVNALTPIVTGYSSDGADLVLSLTPTAGVTYYIRIATTETDSGFRVAFSPPAEDVEAAEPVQHLVVTVHAGAAGGTWAGVSYEPNEKITELPNRTGAQFQETLNVPGSGSLTLRQSDLILRAYNPDDWPINTDGSWATTQNTYDEDPFQLLQFGNFIKFWMNNECVSGFIIKAREVSVIGQGEEAERIITISGPTLHYLLNDFLVMHDNYPEHRNSETRSFTWASIVGPGDKWQNGGWFDATGTFSTHKRAWNHPINADTMSNPPGYVKKQSQPAKKRPKYVLLRAKKPKWPDTKAKWMWIHQNKHKNDNNNFPPTGRKIKGLHYYRAKSFNITNGGARYRFSAHSDTYYEVWLDGERFLVGNGNESYKKFKSKVKVLKKTTPKRSHSLAVYVEDRKNKGKDLDHNDAFILTVQQLNKKGKVKKTILRSNSASWYAWHGRNPPTWSRAMVLAKLIREAQERNNDSAKLLTLRDDFGQVSEEGPESRWPDTKKLSVNLEVGMTVLDVQAGFSESNVFDVQVDPDTLEVKAWQGGKNGSYPLGRNKANNIALVPGQNLVNWSVSEADEMKTQLLVRYDGGYVNVIVGPDDVGYKGYLKKYGRREAFVELGTFNSEDVAKSTGVQILSGLTNDTTISGSSDIVGHFSEGYSGSIVPVKGSVPFLDFQVGDTIAAPGSNGFLRHHRVLSLTCTEDENGVLTFDPELEGV